MMAASPSRHRRTDADDAALFFFFVKSGDDVENGNGADEIDLNDFGNFFHIIRRALVIAEVPADADDNRGARIEPVEKLFMAVEVEEVEQHRFYLDAVAGFQTGAIIRQKFGMRIGEVEIVSGDGVKPREGPRDIGHRAKN